MNKNFFFKKQMLIFNAFMLMFFACDLCAATLKVGMTSVILMAGQTIEVPLYSSKPITSDLTARGMFQSNDVSIVPSPKCHLSAYGCSLMITATPNSQNYTMVPVVVSESGATNKPIFVLSVVHPGQPKPENNKLPNIISTPMILSDVIGNELRLTFTNTTSSTLNHVSVLQLPNGVSSNVCPMVAPGATCTLRLVLNNVVDAGDYVVSIHDDQNILQYRILTIAKQREMISKQSNVQTVKSIMSLATGNLSASIIPHSINSTYYTASSNGPVYQMIQVTNNGASSVTLDPLSITGTDASFFSIDSNAADYAGAPIFCNNAPTTLANGESCEIIINSTLGDPSSAPATATLTISDGVLADTLSFSLIDTTYIYSGGGFNTLGNASVSGGDLLAQCTAGTCSNALQGSSGNNYSYVNNSVGQWINALSITPTGNLIVGGVFGAIGGATSGASSGTAAMLAQCIPGGNMTGNACFNQINTGSTTNSYAINNAYIDAVTFLGTSSLVLGGDFSQIRITTISAPNKLLAKCAYNGVSANQTCSQYLTGATTKYANNTIAALTSLLGSVNVGGLFSQIAGYPTSAPSSGTTFATCSSSACSQGMGTGNPNNSVLGMTNDGSYLYMGGIFTSIGSYVDTSGGYPLVKCTPNTPTTCQNALNGSYDANGYIEGLVYSGGLLYVGGKFSSIGGATPVSSGNMLAVCTPGGTCANFVTDNNPYAIGTDWGGAIFALAVGNQTSIVQN